MKLDFSPWNQQIANPTISSFQLGILFCGIGIASVGGVLAIETLLSQLVFTFEMIGMFSYGAYDGLFKNGFFGLPRWILTIVVVLIGGYILGMELWVVFNARTHSEFLRVVSFETALFVGINAILLAHNGPSTLLFVLGVPLVVLMIVTVFYGVMISPILFRFLIILLGFGVGVLVALVLVELGINNAFITVSVLLGTTLGVTSFFFQRAFITERVFSTGITVGSVWLISALLFHGLIPGSSLSFPLVLGLLPLGLIVGGVRLYPGITTIMFPVFSGSWVLTAFLYLGNHNALSPVLRGWWVSMLLGVDLLVNEGISAVPNATGPALSAFTVSPIGFSVIFIVFSVSGFVVQYTRYVDSRWVFIVGYYLQDKFVVLQKWSETTLVEVLVRYLGKTEHTGWDSLRYRPRDERTNHPYQ